MLIQNANGFKNPKIEMQHMGQIPMNNQLHVNQAGGDTSKIS